MSLISVQINFGRSKLASNFLDQVTLVIAETLDQNIEDVSGDLIENNNLFWCGSADPAFYVVVQSVQVLNRERNNVCAKAISECLSHASGVPENRIFINFVEKVLSDVAVNGSLLWQSS